METSTVTSKGQVTIPKAVRDALGLAPGDRVLFVRHHDGQVTLWPQNGDLRALAGSVRTSVRGVTLEDMEEGIAEGALASAGFAAKQSVSDSKRPAASKPAKRARGRGKPAVR